MAWIFIIIGLMFAFGGVLTAVRQERKSSAVLQASSTRSYFGVDGFEDATGGVTFDNVEPPGGPADKAGLVGGDIITSFDGRSVSDEDEIE